MKSKFFTIVLSTALTASLVTGCGNLDSGDSTNASIEDELVATTDAGADTTESVEVSSDNEVSSASFDELVASLHVGQSYAYAPICEGEDALLVTSYAFDDLEGHQATYEATIYMEKAGSIAKVTTVQSGGSAFPMAVTDDNCLILPMRNSVQKGYVSKESGEFVVTEESTVNYSMADEELYHNYKDGVAEVVTDSSLFDELSEKYSASDVLSFTKTGIASDNSPVLAGAVYVAYEGDDLYNVSNYYAFENETAGNIQTPDGLSGIPFTYEVSGEDITFHFASADDTSEAKFAWENGSYPTITFPENNGYAAGKISLVCLGTQSPETFDATKYYDNDNNLYMNVKSFDEKSFTGSLCREERIKAEYVDNAEEGSNLYSVNGTQFTVVSFEEVNDAMAYGDAEALKADVVGISRFDKFLVKDNEDDSFYALEKEDYEDAYTVVQLMYEGDVRKTIEENVTFKIKENCEIFLQKFVETDGFGELTEEFILGREFKGDNYPGWSADAKEYYMTNEMLMAISVIDGELYNAVQIYVP